MEKNIDSILSTYDEIYYDLAELFRIKSENYDFSQDTKNDMYRLIVQTSIIAVTRRKDIDGVIKLFEFIINASRSVVTELEDKIEDEEMEKLKKIKETAENQQIFLKLIS